MDVSEAGPGKLLHPGETVVEVETRAAATSVAVIGAVVVADPETRKTNFLHPLMRTPPLLFLPQICPLQQSLFHLAP